MATSYVYILQSDADPDRYYTGLCDDLRVRLAEHNAGKTLHTAKFRPWTVISYTAFRDRAKAAAFETYLKSGSGRAFGKRHLR